MQAKQLIGLTGAAKYLGWSIGRFAYYYYGKSPQPIPPIREVDGHPTFDSAELDAWKIGIKRGKGGRKLKNQ